MIERIYLGDRAIKNIEIDCWEKVIRIKIDCISRIEIGTDNWNFYEKEDICDGYLVFSNVSDFEITPLGSIPDDYIVNYKFSEISGNEYVFNMYSGGTIPSAPDKIGGCYTLIKHEDSWLENSLKEKVE
jgi:hypothetical protein